MLTCSLCRAERDTAIPTADEAVGRCGSLLLNRTNPPPSTLRRMKLVDSNPAPHISQGDELPARATTSSAARGKLAFTGSPLRESRAHGRPSWSGPRLLRQSTPTASTTSSSPSGADPQASAAGVRRRAGTCADEVGDLVLGHGRFWSPPQDAAHVSGDRRASRGDSWRLQKICSDRIGLQLSDRRFHEVAGESIRSSCIRRISGQQRGFRVGNRDRPIRAPHTLPVTHGRRLFQRPVITQSPACATERRVCWRGCVRHQPGVYSTICRNIGRWQLALPCGPTPKRST